MRARTGRLAKITLFLCLIFVFCAGAASLPEIAPRISPKFFFTVLIQSAEHSIPVEERRGEVNRQIRRALVMRLAEMAERGESPPPGALVTKERAELALVKTRARDARNNSDLILARQKFERMKRLAAKRWVMGWSLSGKEPGSLGPGAGPGDPGWTIAWPPDGTPPPKNVDGPGKPIGPGGPGGSDGAP